jgi:dTDP-4-dehydrorhamnose reductase
VRILVTGGGGQVGCEVAAHLPNHEVMVLGRNELDVAERDAVEQVLGTVLPDAVVNCAAYTNVDGCETDP